LQQAYEAELERERLDKERTARRERRKEAGKVRQTETSKFENLKFEF